MGQIPGLSDDGLVVFYIFTNQILGLANTLNPILIRKKTQLNLAQ